MIAFYGTALSAEYQLIFAQQRADSLYLSFIGRRSKFVIYLQQNVSNRAVYDCKSDPRDQTDWSTDYAVLHIMCCSAVLRVVLMKYLFKIVMHVYM